MASHPTVTEADKLPGTAENDKTSARNDITEKTSAKALPADAESSDENSDWSFLSEESDSNSGKNSFEIVPPGTISDATVCERLETLALDEAGTSKEDKVEQESRPLHVIKAKRNKAGELVTVVETTLLSSEEDEVDEEPADRFVVASKSDANVRVKTPKGQATDSDDDDSGPPQILLVDLPLDDDDYIPAPPVSIAADTDTAAATVTATAAGDVKDEERGACGGGDGGDGDGESQEHICNVDWNRFRRVLTLKEFYKLLPSEEERADPNNLRGICIVVSEADANEPAESQTYIDRYCNVDLQQLCGVVNGKVCRRVIDLDEFYNLFPEAESQSIEILSIVLEDQLVDEHGKCIKEPERHRETIPVKSMRVIDMPGFERLFPTLAHNTHEDPELIRLLERENEVFRQQLLEEHRKNLSVSGDADACSCHRLAEQEPRKRRVFYLNGARRRERRGLDSGGVRQRQRRNLDFDGVRQRQRRGLHLRGVRQRQRRALDLDGVRQRKRQNLIFGAVRKRGYDHHEGEAPYGDYAGEVPYGDYAGEVPYGDYAGEVPYGYNAGEVPYGDYVGQVPYGDYAGELLYGDYAVDVPFFERINRARYGRLKEGHVDERACRSCGVVEQELEQDEEQLCFVGFPRRYLADFLTDYDNDDDDDDDDDNLDVDVEGDVNEADNDEDCDDEDEEDEDEDSDEDSDEDEEDEDSDSSEGDEDTDSSEDDVSDSSEGDNVDDNDNDDDSDDFDNGRARQGQQAEPDDDGDKGRIDNDEYVNDEAYKWRVDDNEWHNHDDDDDDDDGGDYHECVPGEVDIEDDEHGESNYQTAEGEYHDAEDDDRAALDAPSCFRSINASDSKNANASATSPEANAMANARFPAANTMANASFPKANYRNTEAGQHLGSENCRHNTRQKNTIDKAGLDGSLH